MTERRGLALLLAPYVFGLMLLVFIPALITFGLALFEWDLITSPKWTGFASFRELWGDDIFRRSIWNSLMWLTDPHDARWAVVLMSLFQIGEGFIVALAVRQSLPGDVYELAELEGAGPWYVFARVTLPLMAPALLLLLFRDTIFSFQANFVPALLIFDGGPPPYATTYLPLFVYTNAFEYLRYGYAAEASLVMFVITAAIVFAQWQILRRWRQAAAV
jgi:ABC-type sugar transport system permease subunit